MFDKTIHTADICALYATDYTNFYMIFTDLLSIHRWGGSFFETGKSKWDGGK